MEKLKLHIPKLVADHVKKLAELFPNRLTEAQDDQGILTRSADSGNSGNSFRIMS